MLDKIKGKIASRPLYYSMWLLGIFLIVCMYFQFSDGRPLPVCYLILFFIIGLITGIYLMDQINKFISGKEKKEKERKEGAFKSRMKNNNQLN